VRALLVLIGTVAVISALVWLANGLVASPAPKTSPAQAAAAAKVHRNYISLVRRLKARAKRVRRIRAARGAWAHRANRICSSALRDVRRTIAAAAPVHTRGELFALFSKLETIEESSLAQLRAIAPPRHDARKVERMLELSSQAFAIDRAAVSALERHDRAAFVRLARQESRLVGRVDALAAGLGADICAEDPFSAADG
jgi:hypothetical protein